MVESNFPLRNPLAPAALLLSLLLLLLSCVAEDRERNPFHPFESSSFRAHIGAVSLLLPVGRRLNSERQEYPSYVSIDGRNSDILRLEYLESAD